MEKVEVTQKELSDFVGREVYYNQSMLVDHLLNNMADGFTHEDITNLYEPANVNADEQTPKEIYEWWIVSDWLLKKLEAHGEPVLHTDYGDWWGRTCTGQSISLDGVIEDIYKELHNN